MPGGRNHIPASELNPPNHHHSSSQQRLLHHLIEERAREIKTLLHDNQRLATSHVSLKGDVTAAEDELRHLSAAAASVKAERDARVNEVYERSLKLEAEARGASCLSEELDRVRADVEKLRNDRVEMTEKLRVVDEELARARSELRDLPNVEGEIEAVAREIQRGRAAIEYEKKIRAKNSELNEAMESHLISMAREAEKLRSELANAEKRAAEAAVAAASAANPGPGYAAHQGNLVPGYGANSLSVPYGAYQV